MQAVSECPVFSQEFVYVLRFESTIAAAADAVHFYYSLITPASHSIIVDVQHLGYFFYRQKLFGLNIRRIILFHVYFTLPILSLIHSPS